MTRQRLFGRANIQLARYKYPGGTVEAYLVYGGGVLERLRWWAWMVTGAIWHTIRGYLCERWR